MKLKHTYLNPLFSVALMLASMTPSLGQDKRTITQQSLNASSMLLLKVDSNQLAIPEKIQQMQDQYKDNPIAAIIDVSQSNLNSFREVTKGQTVYQIGRASCRERV